MSEQTNEAAAPQTLKVSGVGEFSELKNAPRPVRRARLRLTRIDPWSMMKTAFLFSVAGLIVLLVATALLWSVIAISGALGQVEEAMNALLSNADGSGAIQITDYVDFPRVMGLALVFGAINVVLMTALATLGAFLYNVSCSLLGGVEVTLSEE
ncbi:DUF3566 domain-containing protein [Propionimicrobium lymphophilum]|uniref:DUF3566 domain-containing protein n=1 Tax=Propionimicrobium lymphophilum ACS-093-V-SCH5 TaxID=883161 RepID=S2X203_9ACTN|nr:MULTISPECIES: DUF3566 domain-containing protein [Propionimicrobium]EPD34049.1 hypothetical protein HMPREF9306_00084 [Propionimicrobium lymphophilum ACS-093-V-SCH5]ETJ97377.1 transmembrane PF12089 domain protein [Propionimicrobium sp. BV2F7]MDK7710358.1 DUF3566 domain-containing protein [Propionimicrobium lymphophilum]MDK7733792.1 DUF3566 domain-containing protein [Propionimicrobium lymphophilum]